MPITQVIQTVVYTPEGFMLVKIITLVVVEATVTRILSDFNKVKASKVVSLSCKGLMIYWVVGCMQHFLDLVVRFGTWRI